MKSLQSFALARAAPAAMVALCATLTLAADSEITKFMQHLQVIPDLISEGPKDFLNITYSSGVRADKGVELTPTQVKDAPTVSWLPESNQTYYTLIMTDPDAPSREDPILGEWHHWLVVNIPGNDVAAGEVLSEYIGSGPPKDSGLHRYVFLLYQQLGKQQFNKNHLSNTSDFGREKFSTKNFVHAHKLVTPPAAGNFYSAQYDAYVDKLYEQLSQTGRSH